MANGASPSSSSWDLVDVEPEAIRPVEKPQAVTSPELDSSLAPRVTPPPNLPTTAVVSSDSARRRQDQDDGGTSAATADEPCVGSSSSGVAAASDEEEERRREVPSTLTTTTTTAPVVAGVNEHEGVTTKRTLAAPLDAFILDNVVSHAECGTLIDCAASLGYSFWNPAVGQCKLLGG